MDFNEYQKKTRETAIYPEGIRGLSYLLLGLCGESGEIAEKFKKIIRDEPCFEDAVNLKKEEIKKELGDALWYLASISYELGISLEDIAIENINKLSSRKERGTLNGSGDNR